LKPHNLLLDAPTGKIKLTDFSCAIEIMMVDSTLTSSKTIPDGTAPRGTTKYSSPEILRAEPVKSLSVASDYWSIGCILFALLNGKSPFARESKALSVHATLEYCSEKQQEKAEEQKMQPSFSTMTDFGCVVSVTQSVEEFSQGLLQVKLTDRENFWKKHIIKNNFFKTWWLCDKNHIYYQLQNGKKK
jgi:serine/threonine protein kinase